MRNAEQNEILGTFMDMLAGPTGDGGNKRASGDKVYWKVDPGHEAALDRHMVKHAEGETYDQDSQANHYIHVAWRALALAWQEDERNGKHPPDPDGNKFILAEEMRAAMAVPKNQLRLVLEGELLEAA